MDQQFSTCLILGINGLEAITPVHLAEAEQGFIFTVYPRRSTLPPVLRLLPLFLHFINAKVVCLLLLPFLTKLSIFEDW